MLIQQLALVFSTDTGRIICSVTGEKMLAVCSSARRSKTTPSSQLFVGRST
jgi:hypothetical protein